ncbi:methyltransferase [Pseudomonas aeruginosa]|uniref:methyltransferase n=1 Tax=Pseudomonas aeruginosa TaxID=287 RepID=UPI001C8D4BD9|nr:methyltransferase [Pseudomonas aeruginosa]
MIKQNMQFSKSDAAVYLLEQAMGFTYQAALRAAAVLGIADYLRDGEKTADELGKYVNADGARLYRVMRMLASKGIFEETREGYFSLNPASEFLITDASHSLRSAVLMLTDETFWLPLGNLVESLRSETYFKDLFGVPFYEYWSNKRNNREGYNFHSGMSSMSSVENTFFVRSYEFPENATVVDIAGGSGGLLLEVLRGNPTLHGILFDQAEVMAENRLGELGDESRWKTVSGSFFEACPEADIYILKYITMDWPKEKALSILQCCRKAMRENSRLLIVEPIIPKGNIEHGGNSIDLLLLGSFDGGQTRTEVELSELLGGAGLKLNRVIETGCYLSIVEAVIA